MKLTTSGQYKTGDGREHQIPKDTTYRTSYFALGNTYVYEDPLSTQVSCTGGRIKVLGTDVDRIVQYVTEEILYRDERILQREDTSLVAFYENLILDCPLDHLHCLRENIMFIWTLGNGKHCPLLSVRFFRGHIISSQDTSEKVLMSTDGSLLRFVIQAKTKVCDLDMIQTNYEELLITPIRNPDGSRKRNLIQRSLGEDPRNIQLTYYISNRDDTLYHTVTSRLREEFKSVLQDSCQRNLEKARLTHFIERRMPSFHTYRLGGANFLTTAGEVVYSYKCRPTLVEALQLDKCYDALPVMPLHSEDLDLHIFPRIPPNEKTQYFIEPITHRITKTATEIPCIDSFFARYVDLFENWFAVTPTFQPTQAPPQLDLPEINKPINFSKIGNEPDFSSGEAGIYYDTDITSLQHYLEMGRVQKALTFKLAEQSSGHIGANYISPSKLFPPGTIPGGSWHSFILGKLWGWFISLGETFSAIMAITVIVRLLWFLIKLMLNCRLLYAVHGCSRTLMWALCSDVLFSFNYKKAFNFTNKTVRGRNASNDSIYPHSARRHSRRPTNTGPFPCCNDPSSADEP